MGCVHLKMRFQHECRGRIFKCTLPIHEAIIQCVMGFTPMGHRLQERLNNTKTVFVPTEMYSHPLEHKKSLLKHHQETLQY